MKKVIFVITIVLFMAVGAWAQGFPEQFKEIPCPDKGVRPLTLQPSDLDQAAIKAMTKGEKEYFSQCSYENGATIFAFWSENFASRKKDCEGISRKPGDYAVDIISPAKFTGAGIQFQIQNDSVVILNVVKGSSSEAAGLRPDDRIVAIDGKQTKGFSLEEVAERIKKDSIVGSTVKLLIYRPSTEEYSEKELTLTEVVNETVSMNFHDPTHLVIAKAYYPNKVDRIKEDDELWRSTVIQYMKTIEKQAVSCMDAPVASTKGPAAVIK